MTLPSGDQNGIAAPSVSGSTRAATPFTDRSQSRLSAAVAPLVTNASDAPSGDIANDPVSSSPTGG
jgi:hypothetical protein